jgi:hypothetical protein
VGPKKDGKSSVLKGREKRSGRRRLVGQIRENHLEEFKCSRGAIYKGANWFGRVINKLISVDNSIKRYVQFLSFRSKIAGILGDGGI